MRSRFRKRSISQINRKDSKRRVRKTPNNATRQHQLLHLFNISWHEKAVHYCHLLPQLHISLEILLSFYLASIRCHGDSYFPVASTRDQLYGACLQQDRNHLHHSKNAKRAVFPQDDSALSTSLQCLVSRTEEDITGSFNFLPTSHGHDCRRK